MTVTYLGNGVMSEIGRHGEPDPGVTAFCIHNWDVKHGRADVFVDHVSQTGDFVDGHPPHLPVFQPRRARHHPRTA
jgi:hypothetical protein